MRSTTLQTMLSLNRCLVLVLLAAGCAPAATEDVVDDADDVEPTAGERALAAVNALRDSAGVRPVVFSAALEAAAQAHADFYAQNPDVYAEGLSPHEEGPGGNDLVGRLAAVGYNNVAAAEVMHFLDDPELAVAGWRDTVFHRIPLIDPATAELGYGHANEGGRNVDVMDFVVAPAFPFNTPVRFPAADAVDVPRLWDGLEGPQPPAPPGGFPSGPVVTLTFAGGQQPVIDRHEVFVDEGPALEHVFLTPDDPSFGAFLGNTYSLYASGAVNPGSRVHVIIAGTLAGAAFTQDWSFTTCTDCPQ